MPSQYIGTPTFSTQITIPNDGELASAASVNNPTKSEADMDYYLLQSLGLITQGSSIRLNSIDGNTISVSPISSIVVAENGLYKLLSSTSIVSIGVAELEVGAVFNPNQWYYIYAFSLAGNLAFQISITQPDIHNLYKQSTNTHRYLGSFRTNAGSKIVKFNASRGNYLFYERINELNGGKALTSTAINLLNVPPTSRYGYLNIYCKNTGVASNFKISSYQAGPFLEFNVSANLTSGTTFTHEISLNDSSQIYYLVGSANVSLDFYLAGYKE